MNGLAAGETTGQIQEDSEAGPQREQLILLQKP